MNYLKKLPYKIKLFLFILPLLFIYTLICSISYVNAISTDLQKNVYLRMDGETAGLVLPGDSIVTAVIG